MSARHRLDCASSRREALDPAGSGKRLDYDAACRALVRLFLRGSAVSVVTFWANSQSYRFCAEVASKFLRPWVADSWMASDSDLVPMRWVRKSKAELVLALEISMTLAA